jgi:hypothetical protein
MQRILINRHSADWLGYWNLMQWQNPIPVRYILVFNPSTVYPGIQFQYGISRYWIPVRYIPVLNPSTVYPGIQSQYGISWYSIHGISWYSIPVRYIPVFNPSTVYPGIQSQYGISWYSIPVRYILVFKMFKGKEKGPNLVKVHNF